MRHRLYVHPLYPCPVQESVDEPPRYFFAAGWDHVCRAHDSNTVTITLLVFASNPEVAICS